MSGYEESRAGPGFDASPPGLVWDGKGTPPPWVTGNWDLPMASPARGCGCDSCEANTGGDGDRGFSGGSNPYEMLRRLNASSRDPLTAREEARAAAAAELAGEETRDGRDSALELRRFRNPDGGNLSGSAAREIVRLTEFRVLPPGWEAV